MKTDFKYLDRAADDARTRKRLREIQALRVKVMEKKHIVRGENLFSLRLGGMNFWLRKNGAYCSIDTYLEIFRNRAHMETEGFDGKGAKVVVDAGANEGYYTLKIKRRNPKARVIAVEPMPKTIEVLKKNLKANGFEDVEVVRAALGAKNGRATLEFVPEITVIAAKRIYDQPRDWLPKKRIRKLNVRQMTLPSLCAEKGIDEIDLLKLDVEASEMEILKGAKKMLPKIRKMVIEWHTPKLKKQCIAFMKRNGFRMVCSAQIKGMRCGDIYFINQKSSKR